MSAFIEARKALGFAVALTCRSIGTSPSAYYQRATGALSARATEDERLLAQIRRVYRANYEAYGSLRVWKALRREGIIVGRGRSASRRRRSASSRGSRRRVTVPRSRVSLWRPERLRPAPSSRCSPVATATSC